MSILEDDLRDARVLIIVDSSLSVSDLEVDLELLSSSDSHSLRLLINIRTNQVLWYDILNEAREGTKIVSVFSYIILESIAWRL